MNQDLRSGPVGCGCIAQTPQRDANAHRSGKPSRRQAHAPPDSADRGDQDDGKDRGQLEGPATLLRPHERVNILRQVVPLLIAEKVAPLYVFQRGRDFDVLQPYRNNTKIAAPLLQSSNARRCSSARTPPLSTERGEMKDRKQSADWIPRSMRSFHSSPGVKSCVSIQGWNRAVSRFWYSLSTLSRSSLA